MITVGKATSAAYYTDGDGGGGMESYYLDAVTEGEPPGRWAGSGAVLLGLEGEVSADDMETLFEDFVSPVDGRALGLRPANRVKAKELVAAALAAEPDASRERRAQIRAEVASQVRASVIGWDLTFAVPKSVTVLHTAATRGQIAAARAGDAAGEAAFGWIRAQIDEAIRVANAAGLRAAESVVTARAGGGAGGAMRWERARAVVFASFYQHTSRSIEPHLHVHNVALNKVLCGDGRWRAIDGQDLLAQRYAFSAVADRALIEYLAGLGLGFRDRPDEAGKEADLVPEPVLDHFSTRHHQMDAKLAPLTEAFTEKYGREPTSRELSQLKTYAQRSSRAGKAHGDQTADELNDAWVADLRAEAGHDLEATGHALLRAVLARMPAELREALPAAVREAAAREAAERARAGAGSTAGAGAESGDGTVAGLAGVLSPETVIAKAVAGCAARSATWGRANLLLEIERNLPVLGIDPGQVAELLETLTDRAVASSGVVRVTGPDAADRAAGAGVPLYAAPSATLYAAAGTLAAEEALRAAAVTRGRFAVDRAAVGAWLDAHTPTIGADQRAAVEGIASSDAAVTVLVGPAGTGKSFAAGALAGAWSDLTEGEGRVIGLAVSKIAARVLADDGIPLARNVTKWLVTQERLEEGRAGQDERAWALRARDVVLVDEASMVGTAALEAVRARVEAAGARLLLAGDPHQLGAVEAGGVMGLLEDRAETYTLTEVRRFTHEWERGASLALRDGAAHGLDEYDRHARLAEYPTVEQAAAAAARAAVADRVAGRSTVVVTASNGQAAAVAARVRDQLIDLGLVAPAGGVLTGRDGNTAGVGDIITCRRNDYALGVTNRVQYRVIATGTDGAAGAGLPEGALIVEPLTPAGPEPTGAADIGPERGARTVLPPQYVAADVQLGYASTVHAAQGLTVDTAHLVAGGGAGLDAATLYVAMTRGRDRNTAHVALATPGKPSAPAAATPGGGQVRLEDDSTAPSARAVLEAGLADTTGLRQLPASGTAATVAAEHDAARAGSMATLTARLEAETRTACRARLERQLDDLAAAGILDQDTRAHLAADQASEHLSRLLRVVETDGRDPARVLHDAVTRGRSLIDADSPAQVLAHRITRGRPDHALTGPAPATGSAVPAGIPAPVAARLADLHARAAARAVELGHQMAQTAPEWAVQALGPVPPENTAADTTTSTDGTTSDTDGAAAEDGTPDAAPDAAADVAADRADWERRAGLVAAHREAVGHTDPVRALPSMPGLTSTERRAGYAVAWQALGRPEADLTEAAMSEGRLRVRAQAWTREQAWAPPFVDDVLRAAETDLHAARQAAALAAARADQADAEGDPERAAKWRDEADQQEQAAHVQAAAVEGLTRQAQTYTAWIAHTTITRDLAERARAEADRRGVDLDTPPADTTTAREWLTAHTAAIAAEDAWRPITDTDLATDLTDDDAADHGADDTAADEDAADEDAAGGDAAGGDAGQDRPRTAGTDNQDAEAAPPTASTTPDQRTGITTTAATVAVGEVAARPELSMAELELMTAGAAAVQAVLADRDNQEAAHTAAVQEDLAIEAAEAGRRRRELADLDAALAAGHPAMHTALGTDPGTDPGGTAPDEAARTDTGAADGWAD